MTMRRLRNLIRYSIKLFFESRDIIYSLKMAKILTKGL
jgi:hypothetical protein